MRYKNSLKQYFRIIHFFSSLLIVLRKNKFKYDLSEIKLRLPYRQILRETSHFATRPECFFRTGSQKSELSFARHLCAAKKIAHIIRK